MKNNLKLAVDIILLTNFILVMTISRGSFHEIAGVGISCILLAHGLLNLQWFQKINLRLFNSRLQGTTRLTHWMNFLLFVSMLLTIASGILISKVLFPQSGVHQGFRGIHSMLANLSLLLVGIHIGLHWQWLAANTIQVIKKKPYKLIGKIAILIIVSFLLFGGYKLISDQVQATSSVKHIPGVSNQQQARQSPRFIGSKAGAGFQNRPRIAERADKQPFQNGVRFKREHRSSTPELVGFILNAAIISVIASITHTLKIRTANK